MAGDQTVVAQFLVDLAEVTFMDARALGVLVSAHRSARDTGGSLQLTAHPQFARLLEFTGLTEMFSISTGADS